MQTTLKGLWVRLLPTTKGTRSLLFSWFLQVLCLLAFLFCLFFDGSSHQSFIGFLWSQNKKVCHFTKLFFSFPFLSLKMFFFCQCFNVVGFLGFQVCFVDNEVAISFLYILGLLLGYKLQQFFGHYVFVINEVVTTLLAQCC